MVGCSGTADTAAPPKCEVSVPLTDIPARSDQGRCCGCRSRRVERTTKLDSDSIRFAIRDSALAADGFTPTRW